MSLIDTPEPKGTPMIQAASHLTTNLSTFDTLLMFMKSAVQPALLTGVIATILVMVLLSTDQLLDTSLPLRQRLRTSPLSKLVVWAFIGMSIGVSCFTIAFFAQVVSLYTGINHFESAMYVFVGLLALCAIPALAYLLVADIHRRRSRSMHSHR